MVVADIHVSDIHGSTGSVIKIDWGNRIHYRFKASIQVH